MKKSRACTRLFSYLSNDNSTERLENCMFYVPD